MKRSRFRKKRSGGGSNWLTTYSDMVTLILAFFVILFSMSTIDAVKFESAATSLQMALGILEGGRSLNPQDLKDDGRTIEQPQATPAGAVPDIEAWEMEQLRDIQLQLEQALQGQGIESNVGVNLEERGVVVRFSDDVLFDSGRAQLRPEAHKVLDTVAAVLITIPNHVRVEGHTDSKPIHTERFPSNWELSTARATNVIRYLLSTTVIAPARLSAAGYSWYRPLAPNDSRANRRRNRRVDLVILRMSLSSAEPWNRSDSTDSDRTDGSPAVTN